MSIPLPSVTLPAPTVGQTGTIDLSKFLVSASPEPAGSYGKLEVINESGAGILVTFSVTPATHWRVPANRQRTLAIPAGESRATWVVEYVLPAVYTGIILFAYYNPWDDDPPPVSATGGTLSGNQARNLAVPLGAQSLMGRAITIIANQDITLRTDPLSTALLANRLVYCHLYWAYFRTPGSGATNEGADVTLFADLMNGATILQSLPMHNAITFGEGSPPILSPDWWSPGFTKWNLIVWVPPPTPTGIQWRLHCNSVVAAPTIWWDIGAAIDVNNNVAPGSIGNFTPSTGIF